MKREKARRREKVESGGDRWSWKRMRRVQRMRNRPAGNSKREKHHHVDNEKESELVGHSLTRATKFRHRRLGVENRGRLG